jgi:hypothetical protein
VWGAHTLSRSSVALALLTAAVTCPAAGAGDVAETLLVYRLRGEIRPFLFWVGRDDVGGGRIVIRRTYSSPERWREDVEVLFGSQPERIPGRINRWGYGREMAEWTRDGDAPPRLLATEFQGMMRHSTESSIADVVPETSGAKVARLYDVTRSVVSPQAAHHEFRAFTDAEDFHFQSPERLLGKYRDCLAATPPLRRSELTNARGVWAEPYGFLTAVARLVGEIVDAALKPPRLLQRMRPATVFVYNSKPYTLKVTGVRPEASIETRYGARRIRDVAILEFQCFNTVKRTRTDFTLWTPLAGDLKGLPVRILLQPRWWLRLQLDMDPGSSRISPEPEGGAGGGRP